MKNTIFVLVVVFLSPFYSAFADQQANAEQQILLDYNPRDVVGEQVFRTVTILSPDSIGLLWSDHLEARISGSNFQGHIARHEIEVQSDIIGHHQYMVVEQDGEFLEIELVWFTTKQSKLTLFVLMIVGGLIGLFVGKHI